MALSLTNGNTTELMADYSSPVEDRDTLEFNETAFRRAFVLELKRTGISRQPFILMLVSLAEIPAGRNGSSPRKKAVEAIASSIRDTDMLGWYKSGQAVGVLLTEIDGPLRDVVDSVIERMNAKLSSCLSAEDLQKLSIAVYLLPEKTLQNGMPHDAGEDFNWPSRRREGVSVVEEHRAYH